MQIVIDNHVRIVSINVYVS